MRDQFNARLSEPDIPELVITPLLKTKISFNLFDMIDREEREEFKYMVKYLNLPEKFLVIFF
jgi:hypothetical protein